MSKKRLIMVVDANRHIRQSISGLLQEKGYDVLTAQDGIEALWHIARRSPDLIILDMNMPQVGGIEFYASICNDNHVPHYPLFSLTDRAELGKLFKNSIVKGFIVKPFDLNNLLHEIEGVFAAKTIEKKAVKNIAIVDDQDNQLRELCELFSRAGYRILPIKSGLAALEQMYEEPEDLILVRLGLKDIAGDLVAARLKHMTKTSHALTLLYTPRYDQSGLKVVDQFKKKNNVCDIIVFDEPREILEGVEQRI